MGSSQKPQIHERPPKIFNFNLPNNCQIGRRLPCVKGTVKNQLIKWILTEGLLYSKPSDLHWFSEKL